MGFIQTVALPTNVNPSSLETAFEGDRDHLKVIVSGSVASQWRRPSSLSSKGSIKAPPQQPAQRPQPPAQRPQPPAQRPQQPAQRPQQPAQNPNQWPSHDSHHSHHSHHSNHNKGGIQKPAYDNPPARKPGNTKAPPSQRPSQKQQPANQWPSHDSHHSHHSHHSNHNKGAGNKARQPPQRSQTGRK